MAAILLEAGVVFAFIAVAGALADRIDQSVIPAYLVAGLLVGPHAPTVGGYSLALVEQREFIELLSTLGVVFLLFFIGLEFNLERLLRSRTSAVRAGLVDLGLNGGVGLAVGLAFGFGPIGALFLAGIIAISSSAVVTKSLLDLGWIADPESEAILGVLVVEDVVVAFYLAIMGAIALGGSATEVLSRFGLSAVVLAALILLAHSGARPLSRLLETRSDEQFLIRVVGSAVAVGGVAVALGVSEAVAAFFLGAAFGATPEAERIQRVITSERDLYAAVFFFSIGLETDPRLFGAVALPLAIIVPLTATTKLLSGYVGGRAYNLSTRRARRVGFALVARGEFSLVVAALAATAGTSVALTETIPALAVGYVLVMSVLGTLLMRASPAIEARYPSPGGR